MDTRQVHLLAFVRVNRGIYKVAPSVLIPRRTDTILRRDFAQRVLLTRGFFFVKMLMARRDIAAIAFLGEQSLL